MPDEKPPESKIILYASEDGQVKVDVILEGDDVWLSQRQMAELFEKDVRTINEHILNIYEESELQRDETIRNFRIVQTEGAREVTRDIEFYNLDVIISASLQGHALTHDHLRAAALRTRSRATSQMRIKAGQNV